MEEEYIKQEDSDYKATVCNQLLLVSAFVRKDDCEVGEEQHWERQIRDKGKHAPPSCNSCSEIRVELSCEIHEDYHLGEDDAQPSDYSEFSVGDGA